MDKYFIGLTESSLFSGEFSGSFVTSFDGVLCTLELKVHYKSLRGCLILDGLNFEIRGFCSSVVKAAYGVLLEPLGNTPVALLKMTSLWCGIKLELDVPNFEVKTLYQPHAFEFRRVPRQPCSNHCCI